MIDKHTHLFNRAGFGKAFSYTPSVKDSMDSLIRKSSKDTPLNVVDKPQVNPADMRNASEEKKKKLKQELRKNTLQLNVAWAKQMVIPEVAFREKLTLFWHDHFACRTPVAYLAQQQNNAVRKNAVGSFRSLLTVVSKDPAMLQFLNSQQNKKDSPNENFARELMELFTLGRGNYTEDDVKSAARAFTGWTFNPLTGEFVFRPRVHDTGPKEFRGKKGNFNGEEILEMILEDRKTAGFITKKIWSYFVSTENRNEAIIDDLSRSFYQSDYNIEKLFRSIYNSDWFYEKQYIGNKIKSPIELIIGIQVHTQGFFKDELSVVFMQRALGQILFNPPNVGGWPAGNAWIDSSSLTFRMSLPGILFRNEATDFQAKDDGDANNITNDVRKSKILFSVDWNPIASHFMKSKSADTLDAIETFLLTQPISGETKELIRKYSEGAMNDLEFIQRAYTGFMSLPEYQLS